MVYENINKNLKHSFVLAIIVEKRFLGTNFMEHFPEVVNMR